MAALHWYCNIDNYYCTAMRTLVVVYTVDQILYCLWCKTFTLVEICEKRFAVVLFTPHPQGSQN